MPCPYVVISTAWKISLFSFIAIKTLPLVKREYPQGVGDGIFAVFKLPPLRSSLLTKRDSVCNAVSVRWCFSWSVGADRRVCPECHCYRLFWADTPVRPYARMFFTRIVGTRHAVSAWCIQTPSATSLLVPLRKEGLFFITHSYKREILHFRSG